ncbi:hypothetical protein [Streptomyces sp. NPDC056938]|uniref:hypothetical protein n=1 Tax=unclassified Streptomyces TaxID=2593676 RepID=UPI003629E650
MGHLTTTLHGQAARAAAEITAQADRDTLRGTRREGVDACIRYLTGHADRLHYDTALACCWPIATGAIEGVCRHIIADGLAITGSRWGLDSSEAILKFRAVKDKGDLEEYGRHHLAREHERLCPTPGPHGYRLTA